MRSVLLACALMGIARMAGAQEATPAEQIDHLVQVTRKLPATARQDLVSSKFRAMFKSVDVSDLSDEDLRIRFDAADMASFYAIDPEIIHEQVALFGELDKRHLSKRRDATSTEGELIKARLFDEARAFSDAYPGSALEEIPQVRTEPGLDPAEPTVLRVDDDGLVHESLVPHGTYVIVVGHPLCHFTQNASREIEATDDVAVELGKHATWLGPPDRLLHLQAYRDWNRKHPSQQMVLAYSINDWPEISDWGTPMFYFFKDNALVKIVEGWPKEGHIADLRQGLEMLGFISQPDNGGNADTASKNNSTNAEQTR